MALNDFTGQNIQNSYQKVVQTEGNLFADGTGSALSIIVASQTSSMTVATASYAISASVEITHEVSSSYAQTASMASNNFIVRGHITESENISASGDLSVNTAFVSQSLTFGTSSANIIAPTKLTIKGGPNTNDYLVLANDSFHSFIDGAAILTCQATPGDGSIILNASSNNVDTKIMHEDSSQAIKVDASQNRVNIMHFVSIGSGSIITPTGDVLTINGSQYNFGNITASGDISSSGTITATNGFGIIDGGSF